MSSKDNVESQSKTEEQQQTMEHKCTFCKGSFSSSKALFIHCTEDGPPRCKRMFDSQTLKDIGIPSQVPRIDLSGVLSMLKSFPV